MRQCPQYTLNNVLLNFIEHMKKCGEQIDIRPPNLKIGGRRVPLIPPGLTPLHVKQSNLHKKPNYDGFEDLGCRKVMISDRQKILLMRETHRQWNLVARL